MNSERPEPPEESDGRQYADYNLNNNGKSIHPEPVKDTRETEAELTKLEQLLQVQREYIQFLSDYIGGTAQILRVHRCGASEEDITKGAEFRGKISILEMQVKSES